MFSGLSGVIIGTVGVGIVSGVTVYYCTWEWGKTIIIGLVCSIFAYAVCVISINFDLRNNLLDLEAQYARYEVLRDELDTALETEGADTGVTYYLLYSTIDEYRANLDSLRKLKDSYGSLPCVDTLSLYKVSEFPDITR